MTSNINNCDSNSFIENIKKLISDGKKSKSKHIINYKKFNE